MASCKMALLGEGGSPPIPSASSGQTQFYPIEGKRLIGTFEWVMQWSPRMGEGRRGGVGSYGIEFGLD